jgi:hypothetical protein
VLTKEQLKTVPKVSKGRKTGKKGKKCPTSQEDEKQVPPKPAGKE